MNEWRIPLSRQAKKFLDKQQLEENLITENILLGVKKLTGEDINIDMKKLSGKWEGYHRIRQGKIRIIVKFEFDANTAEIEIIDWRTSAYR